MEQDAEAIIKSMNPVMLPDPTLFPDFTLDEAELVRTIALYLTFHLCSRREMVVYDIPSLSLHREK